LIKILSPKIFEPHLSLLYCTPGRIDIKRIIESIGKDTFSGKITVLNKLVLVRTRGQISNWEIVKEFQL